MIHSWIFWPVGRVWIEIQHRLSRAGLWQSREVTLPGFDLIKVDTALTFIGDNCLRTVLITKFALNRAAAGTVLEISSDNLSAVETIPFMLADCNCEHLATVNAHNCQKIYLRKRSENPSPQQGPGRAGTKPKGEDRDNE